VCKTVATLSMYNVGFWTEALWGHGQVDSCKVKRKRFKCGTITSPTSCKDTVCLCVKRDRLRAQGSMSHIAKKRLCGETSNYSESTVSQWACDKYGYGDITSKKILKNVNIEKRRFLCLNFQIIVIVSHQKSVTSAAQTASLAVHLATGATEPSAPFAV